VLGFEPE